MNVRLLTLDPAHFHAALVQKEMYPGVAPTVHVYAPLGTDLIAHLQRIAGFNSRKDNPTSWELEVHAGPEPLERMLRDPSGNVVVLSGRNRRKIDYIEAAVGAGLHVLADKPWILRAEDLPRLEAVLNEVEKRSLVAYDIMTERYEITSILQRELVQDADVFGSPTSGTEQVPGVYMQSVHYLKKLVAGVPLRRPAWFFDVTQQGEGLTDVGTHLVDLVQWALFPNQPIDHRTEVHVEAGQRWPTILSPAQFEAVTGEREFPAALAADVKPTGLAYHCNTLVQYILRGIRVTLDVRWEYEAAPGAGDTHHAVFRGRRAAVEIRQGEGEAWRPELYVVPSVRGEEAVVFAALERAIARWQSRWPGVSVQRCKRPARVSLPEHTRPESCIRGPESWREEEARVTIPDRYRVGHEAHFSEVTRQFLNYLTQPGSLPAWEKPGMLAKYHVTTQGVRLAHERH
jgi:predicted dehydrogenase